MCGLRSAAVRFVDGSSIFLFFFLFQISRFGWILLGFFWWVVEGGKRREMYSDIVIITFETLQVFISYNMPFAMQQYIDRMKKLSKKQ